MLFTLNKYLSCIYKYLVINSSTLNAEVRKLTELNCEIVVLIIVKMNCIIFSLLCAHNYTECTCKSERSRRSSQDDFILQQNAEVHAWFIYCFYAGIYFSALFEKA